MRLLYFLVALIMMLSNVEAYKKNSVKTKKQKDKKLSESEMAELGL